jgi:hypothetical protein
VPLSSCCSGFFLLLLLVVFIFVVFIFVVVVVFIVVNEKDLENWHKVKDAFARFLEEAIVKANKKETSRENKQDPARAERAWDKMYKQVSRVFHPDKNLHDKKDAANDFMKLVNGDWEVVKKYHYRVPAKRVRCFLPTAC